MNDDKPVRHPSTSRMFKAAASKWMRLKEEHRVACDRMWAGTIAINFTQNEIATLGDYLSPHDKQLLSATRSATR